MTELSLNCLSRNLVCTDVNLIYLTVYVQYILKRQSKLAKKLGLQKITRSVQGMKINLLRIAGQ